MSGIFGVVSKEDCFDDLFYGTDYQSHLGTQNAGLAVMDGGRIKFRIHGLSTHAFRPQFYDCKEYMKGKSGIGAISDYEPQPLSISSPFGRYAVAHVGLVKNLAKLVEEGYKERRATFSEMSGGQENPTEVIATLINQGKDIVDGIEIVQNSIVGSSTLALLASEGIYLARDRLGRTPLAIGKKENSFSVASEDCAFFNLGYKVYNNEYNNGYFGAGEIGLLTSEGYKQLRKPRDNMNICAFLWVYFGDPDSSYEGIRVEIARERCGAVLARRDLEEGLKVDLVAGVPDSGIGHAIGYAMEMKVPLRRVFRKYNQTWQRSFMPQQQEKRELAGKMKLAPIPEVIKGNKIVLNEDSIVRATQLNARVRDLFDYGAREVHVRPSCPPLMFPCTFLNFSRSRSELDLAARRAVEKIEGSGINRIDLKQYLDHNSEKYRMMIKNIMSDLDPRLTSLRYQRLDDMAEAIGLPLEKLCTYCWTGE